MFDSIKEVPSLGLCKKLKELGYPQDGGGWYWQRIGDNIALVNNPQKRWIVVYLTLRGYLSCLYDQIVVIKAPTCRELGEWMLKVKGTYQIYMYCGYYCVEYCEDECITIEGVAGTFEKLVPQCKERVDADTESNARAKMLIWLRENGYVKFNKKEAY